MSSYLPSVIRIPHVYSSSTCSLLVHNYNDVPVHGYLVHRATDTEYARSKIIVRWCEVDGGWMLDDTAVVRVRRHEVAIYSKQ